MNKSFLKAIYNIDDEYIGITFTSFIDGEDFKSITNIFKKHYGIYIEEEKAWFFTTEDYQTLKNEYDIIEETDYTPKTDISYGLEILNKSRDSRKLTENPEDTRTREEVISDLKNMMQKRVKK